MPVKWQWLRINRDILELLLKERIIEHAYCSDYLVLYSVMGYGILVSFNNAMEVGGLLNILYGLNASYSGHGSKVFEVLLPSSHPIAPNLRKLSKEVEKFILFEKKLN